MNAPVKNKETGVWEYTHTDGTTYEFGSKKEAIDWANSQAASEPEETEEDGESEETPVEEVPAPVALYDENDSELSKAVKLLVAANRNISKVLRGVSSQFGKLETELLNALPETGMPQRSLVDVLSTSAPNVGQAIKHLEEEGGYVESKRSRTDRRAFDIYLTDEGRAVRNKIVTDREKALEATFSGFSDAELAKLAELLQKLA